MARRKWRGTASFIVPAGVREGLMTICPGQEAQQGTRFRAIMDFAAAHLDRLTIINAAGLSVHNFRRLLPGDIRDEGARRLAELRSENWMAMNERHVAETFGARAEIVPMEDITSDPSFRDRSELIQAMHKAGSGPVFDYFEDSLRDDLATRGPRLKRQGVWLSDKVIRAQSLPYLADEYAMRSLMWQRYGRPEFYLGRAVLDPELFQRQNAARPDLDLTIPPLHPIELHEVRPVHDRRLGRPKGGPAPA